MNNYDMMIERYRRELMNASSRSAASARPQMTPTPPDDAEPAADFPARQPDKGFDEYMPVISVAYDDTPNASTEESVMQPEVTADKAPDPKTTAVMGAVNAVSDTSTDKDAPNEPDTPDATKHYGTLRIEVYAAGRAYGIPNARVTVTVTDDPTGTVIYTGLTNTSGTLPDIRLEAPSDSLTKQPSVLKGYSSYDVKIEHPRFKTKKFIGVPIFANVESVQPVQMTPRTETDTPDVIYEREPFSLRQTDDQKEGEQNA